MSAESQFDQFAPDTKAKIIQVRKLIAELPDEARTYMMDQIFTGCLRKLRLENTLADEIADALEAPAALVFVVEDFHLYLDSGHVADASAYHIKFLEMASQALKFVMSEDSGRIH